MENHYIRLASTQLYLFEISDLQLSKAQYSENDTVIAKVKVQNTGSKAGSEVVQLYVRDVLASVSRPIIELKGFQKVELQRRIKNGHYRSSGKTTTVLNENMDWTVEKGTYRIMIGNSSKNLPLKQNIEVL